MKIKTPVTPEQIITPRRREDKQNDLWTTLAAGSGEYDKRWIIGAKCLREKIPGQEPLQVLMVI